MLLLRLASKNLLRNRRRTALTAIAVIAGTGILILGQGLVDGLDENIVVSAINGTSGHVIARPAGYPPEGNQHPIDALLTIDERARALLDTEAVAWTERTYFSPLAASRSDSLRVTAIGFDPSRDEKVFPRDLWSIEGKMPREADDGVAVSPSTARLLRLHPGDRLILQVRTHRGAINALDVAVSGIVRTHNAALDNLTLFVPRTLTAKLIAADAPTHVSVRLANRNDVDAFAPRLGAALGAQAEVATWKHEVEELLQLQEVRRKALNLLVFVLLALAAFGIANTILMAAHERVREVGTLRSLGMTETGVLQLFLLEGALMGLVGGVLGALWGGGLVSYWSEHPLDLGKTLEARSSNLSFSAYVYTQLSPQRIAVALALGVVVAVVASIYPARVASRLAPADAVRAT